MFNIPCSGTGYRSKRSVLTTVCSSTPLHQSFAEGLLAGRNDKDARINLFTMLSSCKTFLDLGIFATVKAFIVRLV